MTDGAIKEKNLSQPPWNTQKHLKNNSPLNKLTCDPIKTLHYKIFKRKKAGFLFQNSQAEKITSKTFKTRLKKNWVDVAQPKTKL